MIGSFLTRGLVMVFGYAYPAYECYKTVEKNKPDIEQLRFWCQYWILVAMLTVFERVGDAFVSWVPMYSEAKLFFFIYLWYPQTKGTAYVYDSFFRPYVAKHETDIDRNLLELRTRAGDYVASNWQKAASYGQTRVFDVLQYIASQSTPRPRTTQPQQSTRDRQPPARQNRKPASKPQPQPEEPPSPASSTSSSEAQEDLAEEEARSEVPAASPDPSAVLNAQISTVTEALLIAGSPKSTNSSGEAMPIESASSSSAKDNINPPPPQDSVMEDATRVTRARSRRAHAAASNR